VIEMPKDLPLDVNDRKKKYVMLEVRDLTTKYITRYNEDVYAVDHVSLKVEEGKSLELRGNPAAESRRWR